MKIPKTIHQVWIGTLPVPTKWTNTWPEKNPNWEYILWDNDKVFSRKWYNQSIIDEYVRRYREEIAGKGRRGVDSYRSTKGNLFVGERATLFAWHVIADILRYEILYEYGGYMPGADTRCLKCIDDKFSPDCELYTVRTGHLYHEQRKELEAKYPNGDPEGYDKILWDRYAVDNASPILAAQKGDPFLGKIIDELHKLKPKDLGEAVDTTGNVFMGKMIRKYKPQNLHMVDYKLRQQRKLGEDYSMHFAGTTKGSYRKGRQT